MSLGLQLRGTPQPPLLLRTGGLDGADAADGIGDHGSVAGERRRERAMVRAPAGALGGGGGGGGFSDSGGADWNADGGPLSVSGRGKEM